ncbi:WhiB family transcriptional regulator [Nocardioides humilatus]|uniref:Transcriptional regulator WhiB n=1 Tax=Nocardioides humilatus TaxID=2607660 RepID=A0A5B1LMM7_9ACTN|nr:WhiB family transcriptional regulator [Nocardioides humilatus]KAA1421793.1 WhiB family transcriptional regulator [Nocardioides humilatus]
MNLGTHAPWADHAACRDEDPELFFPIGHTAAARLQAREAQVICRECRVRAECLDFATGTGTQYGVWGGLDAEQRADLRRLSTRRKVLTESW